MNKDSILSEMRVLYVTAIVVVLDQVTKLLVKGFAVPFLELYHTGLPLGSSYAVLGEFFRITYIENPGMAFGIDVGGTLFLAVFRIAIAGFIIYYLYKSRHEVFVLRLSLAMILGGAIGNLIDRVFYGVFFGEGPLFFGKVVDFLHVDFFDIELFGLSVSSFPVFNVADASVSMGVILLLVFHRRFNEFQQASAQQAAPDSSATESSTTTQITDHHLSTCVSST